VPPHEWHVVERPELRIVSEDLWQLSAALRAATEARPTRREALLQQRESLSQKIRHLLARSSKAE
jgi:hypothetical protein